MEASINNYFTTVRWSYRPHVLNSSQQRKFSNVVSLFVTSNTFTCRILFSSILFPLCPKNTEYGHITISHWTISVGYRIQEYVKNITALSHLSKFSQLLYQEVGGYRLPCPTFSAY